MSSKVNSHRVMPEFKLFILHGTHFQRYTVRITRRESTCRSWTQVSENLNSCRTVITTLITFKLDWTGMLKHTRNLTWFFSSLQYAVLKHKADNKVHGEHKWRDTVQLKKVTRQLKKMCFIALLTDMFLFYENSLTLIFYVTSINAMGMNEDLKHLTFRP